jgi:hypothetical protein
MSNIRKAGNEMVNPNVWHVYPLREEHAHNLTGINCLCDPKVERYANGSALVIHNAAEEAKKKAN